MFHCTIAPLRISAVIWNIHHEDILDLVHPENPINLGGKNPGVG